VPLGGVVPLVPGEFGHQAVGQVEHRAECAVVGHEGPAEQHGLGVGGGGYAGRKPADAGAAEFEECGNHVGYATVTGLARCCASGTMAPAGSCSPGPGVAGGEHVCPWQNIACQGASIVIGAQISGG